MRLLADENVPRPFIEALRTLGFDVQTVDPLQRGESDLAVLQRATAQGRLLLTRDKDFARLARDGHETLGIILLALPAKGRWRGRSAALAERLALPSPANFHGRLTILFEDRIEHIQL